MLSASQHPAAWGRGGPPVRPSLPSCPLVLCQALSASCVHRGGGFLIPLSLCCSLWKLIETRWLVSLRLPCPQQRGHGRPLAGVDRAGGHGVGVWRQLWRGAHTAEPAGVSRWQARGGPQESLGPTGVASAAVRAPGRPERLRPVRGRYSGPLGTGDRAGVVTTASSLLALISIGPSW